MPITFATLGFKTTYIILSLPDAGKTVLKLLTDETPEFSLWNSYLECNWFHKCGYKGNYFIYNLKV